MDIGDTWQLVALVLLLGFSGFFSASETALMSLSKIRIRGMVEEKIAGASKIQQLVENPSKLLGAILVGNNIVNIGASALATSLAIHFFGSVGVGIATVAMTLLVLIFGEITPKSLAANDSEKVSLKIVKLLSFIVTILTPVTVVLLHLTNGIIKLFGGTIYKQQPFFTEEEFKTMINVGHEEGVLEGEEKQMIHNVLEFGESRVTDVMTPRIHMVAIELNSSYEAVIDVFKTQRFSRIPVYEERIDNIVGVLYLKDIVFAEGEREDFSVVNIMREPFFIYEFKPIRCLFAEMRDKIVHIAVVLDEYGGTAGIVTMEDLIEEIVGEINDESDEVSQEIEVIKEDEYVVLGTTRIDLVNEMIGLSIESEDFDSIGGFVTGLLGRLPEEGESIDYHHLKFSIISVDKYRIDKLRILT